MAQRGKATPVNEPEEIDTTLLTTAPDDWEFETVAEESATTVILEDEGDQFIGQYVGQDKIEFEAIDQETKEVKTETFERFVFRARDNRLYAMNKSYKLDEAMSKVQPEQWVRITLVKNIETKRGLNPMKDFRVEVKRGS